jgi:uncharacterized membrane protein
VSAIGLRRCGRQQILLGAAIAVAVLTAVGVIGYLI